MPCSLRRRGFLADFGDSFSENIDRRRPMIGDGEPLVGGGANYHHPRGSAVPLRISKLYFEAHF